jgi:hypothetical protein
LLPHVREFDQKIAWKIKCPTLPPRGLTSIAALIKGLMKCISTKN